MKHTDAKSPADFLIPRLHICGCNITNPHAQKAGVSVCEPFTIQPPVQKIEAGRWLIQRNHVSARMDPHESKVAVALDLAYLVSDTSQLQVLEFHFAVGFMARPFELVGPRQIAPGINVSEVV